MKTITLLFLVIGLTACASMPMDRAHTLRIGVPDLGDPVDRVPTAPDVTNVPGGAMLNLEVVGGTARSADIIVSFAEPIVLHRSGRWQYTVRLTPGRNVFEVAPHSAGLCHAPAGCRFVIIQNGNPHRKSAINTPVIIIDPQQMH